MMECLGRMDAFRKADKGRIRRHQDARIITGEVLALRELDG